VNGRGAPAAASLVVLALLAGCTTTTPVLARQAQDRPSATPTPTATPGPPGAPGPGADGIGDSYYPKAGNGGYDVASYDLDLRYDPASGRLSGKALITATATAGLTQFDLDFRALTVDSITIDGVAATSKRSGDELVVTPVEPITQGSKFVTAISYAGVPQSYPDPELGQVGFFQTADGEVAVGEPEVAASWYPVNDHPRDKATYTVKIAAPDGLIAMSNGVLEGKQSAAGWTTWSWAEAKPMASYLATLVIGHYRVQQTTHDGRPVFLAVATSLDPQIDTELARTPEIVDFLASKFGPYPFDAEGGIVVADRRIRFALENQTRPIYDSSFFQPNRDDSWVIVHELAHQWYGDSVSLDQWREMWLNEGFATYAEWLWSEKNGIRTPQQAFDALYAQADSPIWKIPPGNPSKADLFSKSVYDRGGMTLQALRMTVGDDAFFRILKDWAQQKQYGNATSAEFIALAEQVSGKQLRQLFQDWLYGTVRPPRP
jgi:aminopeptidase N